MKKCAPARRYRVGSTFQQNQQQLLGPFNDELLHFVMFVTQYLYETFTYLDIYKRYSVLYRNRRLIIQHQSLSAIIFRVAVLLSYANLSQYYNIKRHSYASFQLLYYRENWPTPNVTVRVFYKIDNATSVYGSLFISIFRQKCM